MGAGRGGGISGISTIGAILRGFGAFTGAFTAIAGFRALTAPPAGFARRAFAGLALRGFALGAAFRTGFRDGRVFAMAAYATVARVRRQPRCGALKCCAGDSTLTHAAPRAPTHARPHRHVH